MAVPVSSRPRARPRGVSPSSDGQAMFGRVLALLVLGVSVALVLTLPAPRTEGLSFAVASDTALIVSLAAGLGLAVAGAVVGATAHGQRLAAPLAIAAVAWLAPEIVAREDAGSAVRTVAGLATPLLAPALLHLGLEVTRRPRTLARRRLMLAGYAVAATLTVVRSLVWKPQRDPDCWSNCTDNALMVLSAPRLASLLASALDGWAVVSGVGLLLVVAGWWAFRPERSLAWIAAPLAAAAAAVTAHAATRLVRPLETPLEPLFVQLFHVRAGALALLAAGVVVYVVASARRRRALQLRGAELSDVAAGRSLEDLLRVVTGDDALVVLYPVHGVDGVLDARGNRHPRPQQRGRRTVTSLVREGREVALVAYDASRVGVEELRRAVGPAARLAIDNERLRAELLLQLAELQRSRARVVEVGDAERRTLERDLHDGAQHRLLALGHELRRAREAAGDREPAVSTALLEAERGVHKAVDELRAVARGLYPAVLTAEGLEGALWSLSDSSAVPLEVGAVPRRRYAEVVERTVYLIVGAAVETVRGSTSESTDTAGPDAVAVEVAERGEVLVLEVLGVSAELPEPLVDRVRALGGSYAEGRPDGWHVELPCA